MTKISSWGGGKKHLINVQIYGLGIRMIKKKPYFIIELKVTGFNLLKGTGYTKKDIF